MIKGFFNIQQSFQSDLLLWQKGEKFQTAIITWTEGIKWTMPYSHPQHNFFIYLYQALSGHNQTKKSYFGASVAPPTQNASSRDTEFWTQDSSFHHWSGVGKWDALIYPPTSPAVISVWNSPSGLKSALFSLLSQRRFIHSFLMDFSPQDISTYPTS